MSNQTGNRQSNHQAQIETYLEEVKQQIAEIKVTRQKPNLSRKERKALHVLQQSKDLTFKKADKGNKLVVMDKNDKIKRAKSKSMTEIITSLLTSL